MLFNFSTSSSLFRTALNSWDFFFYHCRYAWAYQANNHLSVIVQYQLANRSLELSLNLKNTLSKHISLYPFKYTMIHILTTLFIASKASFFMEFMAMRLWRKRPVLPFCSQLTAKKLICTISISIQYDAASHQTLNLLLTKHRAAMKAVHKSFEVCCATFYFSRLHWHHNAYQTPDQRVLCHIKKFVTRNTSVISSFLQK